MNLCESGGATIDDVAKLAGVSIATVSYVINNKGSISRKTRQRVRLAIADLGYKPNLEARNLAFLRGQMLNRGGNK